MIVFVTGSESTGKTHLAEGLAKHFNSTWVPEYARTYVENLQRPYDFRDVEAIARHQIREIDANRQRQDLVIFDTGLVITKVWFEKKFDLVPDWFEDLFSEASKGYYLLCNPDIPWLPDPVRENPVLRQELDRSYEMEIRRMNCSLERVGGMGQVRLNRAIEIVKNWLEIENRVL